jgi:hypothetical protein
MTAITFKYGPRNETVSIYVVGPHVIVEPESGEESWCLTCTYMQSGESECQVVGWTVDSRLTQRFLKDLPVSIYWREYLAMMPETIRDAVSRQLHTIPGYCED